MNGIVVHQKVGGSTTLCTEGKKRNVAFTKFFLGGGRFRFLVRNVPLPYSLQKDAGDFLQILVLRCSVCWPDLNSGNILGNA